MINEVLIEKKTQSMYLSFQTADSFPFVITLLNG